MDKRVHGQACFDKAKLREPLWRTLISNKRLGRHQEVALSAYETEYLQLLRSPGDAACPEQDAIAKMDYAKAVQVH